MFYNSDVWSWERHIVYGTFCKYATRWCDSDLRHCVLSYFRSFRGLEEYVALKVIPPI